MRNFYSLIGEIPDAEKSDFQAFLDDFEATVKEMEELFGDITKVAGSLSKLLNQLRSQHTLAESDKPFPDEPEILLPGER